MDLDVAKRRLDDLFECAAMPELPEPPAEIVIYGAGNCGRAALRLLQSRGYRVPAFIDAAAAEIGSVEGLPCYAPCGSEAAQFAASGHPILVAVFNYATDSGAIETDLRENGFLEVLPYTSLNAAFPDSLKSRFWMASRDKLRSNRANILKALSLWADDLSCEVFLALVELRLSGNLQLLRRPDRSGQYFPVDLPPVKRSLRFVDGGAFDGDTLRSLCKSSIEAAACFEPDPSNYSKLRNNVDELGITCRTRLFPYGLGRARAEVRFEQARGAASAVSEEGESVIHIASMDECLHDFAPTFIKLDIEGAEIEALMGGECVITKHQPRLAVCLYHRPEHLWEVPLILHSLVPQHSLHLRYHGFNGFDSVAYAIEK